MRTPIALSLLALPLGLVLALAARSARADDATPAPSAVGRWRTSWRTSTPISG